MYIVEDLWKHIKSFLIHNINIHGKHLKNDIYIKQYNHVVQSLPKFRPFDRGDGPFIVYSSRQNNYQYVKFIHVLKYKNIHRSIITYMHRDSFSIGGELELDYLYDQYYNF